MNRRDTARVAFQAAEDQQRAAYRDYAAGCRTVYDEFIRAQFTPDQSMELLHRLLDGLEVAHAST